MAIPSDFEGMLSFRDRPLGMLVSHDGARVHPPAIAVVTRAMRCTPTTEKSTALTAPFYQEELYVGVSVGDGHPVGVTER